MTPLSQLKDKLQEMKKARGLATHGDEALKVAVEALERVIRNHGESGFVLKTSHEALEQIRKIMGDEK